MSIIEQFITAKKVEPTYNKFQVNQLYGEIICHHNLATNQKANGNITYVPEIPFKSQQKGLKN